MCFRMWRDDGSLGSRSLRALLGLRGSVKGSWDGIDKMEGLGLVGEEFW